MCQPGYLDVQRKVRVRVEHFEEKELPGGLLQSGLIAYTISFHQIKQSEAATTANFDSEVKGMQEMHKSHSLLKSTHFQLLSTFNSFMRHLTFLFCSKEDHRPQTLLISEKEF